MKRALIIMGSHKRRGRTSDVVDTLVQALFEHDVQSEVLDINQLEIQHCLDCGHCSKHFGTCVIADDMKKVYNAFKQSNYIVFASPVYFNNVTSKLKVLIDRCQMLFMCKFSHQKPFRVLEGKGAMISLAGAPSYDNQFVGSELTVGLVFKNLDLDMCYHMKISDTDRITEDVFEAKSISEIADLISALEV